LLQFPQFYIVRYCRSYQDPEQYMYRSYTEFAYWSYKIFKNLLISGVFFKNFKLHTPVISITSDWILMILYSFDSSRWEESNGSKIIFLASILIDLFQKMYFTIRYIWHTWEMFGVLSFRIGFTSTPIQNVFTMFGWIFHNKPFGHISHSSKIMMIIYIIWLFS